MFPGKRDRRWFAILLITWGLLFAFTLTAASYFLNFTPGKLDFGVCGGLTLIEALAVCGFGYAGLRFASLCCAFGAVSGFIYMSHIFINGNMELKGLVGLMSGAQLAFIFFMVGLNGQMIAHLMNKRRTAK